MHEKQGLSYEFGAFVLDTNQHVLRRDGVPVSLTPKTFDLLTLLAKNSQRMVPKDEFLKSLWPDTFVDESNLTQQISTARKILGEAAGEDRFIVTIPGKGYRFALAVKEIDPGADSMSTGGTNHRPHQEFEGLPFGNTPSETNITGHRGIRNTRFRWVAVAVIVVGLSAGGSWLYKVHYGTARVARTFHTLAVLPFQNLNTDASSDFLGFSLADAIITKLEYVNSLAVRPSMAIARYRKAPTDIRRTADELHVEALLTGNFIRDGGDLRITAQLIDVAGNSIIWKGSFDSRYDKLLVVHDDLTRQIIKSLQLTLSPSEVESLKPDRRIDPLAYEYYLRGVNLYSQNEFPVSINMLEKSTETDPHYALAWAQLGRSLTANASFELGGRDQYFKAEAAYRKALSLQPSLVDAQIYMANLLTDTGKVENAVPLLKAALKAHPNHAEAHWELGYAYRFSGMLDESITECEHARRLDPGVKLGSSMLNAYLYKGAYDKFLESLPKGRESALVTFYRGFAEYHLGRHVDAAQHFDDAFKLRPSLLHVRVGRALSLSMANRTHDGVEALRATESEALERGVGDPEALYKIAQAYAVLGDKQSALRVLRCSIDNGFFPYSYFKADPLLANLHGDDRFVRLLTLARIRHEQFATRFF